MRKLVFVVDEKYDNKDVLTVLKANNVSRRLITKLKQIENGITKNSIRAKTIDIVCVGDKIEIALNDEKVLVPNGDLNVIVKYEDEDIIIFDKPPFMPVHPSHNHLEDTLGNYFSYICSGLSFRPINRLDRDTSGLCVVAKNSYFATALQRSMSKTYFAIAQGHISRSGIIDKPIARVDTSIIKRCVDDNGQYAVTHYSVLDSNDKYTLCKVRLETGRTHQIRVHFSYIGYPLAGDDMYGGSMFDINRQALHCGEIEFFHPVSKKIIRVISDVPDDMQSLFKE